MAGNIRKCFFPSSETILFFSAIKLVDNPAIVSFIVNPVPGFTLILGLFFNEGDL